MRSEWLVRGEGEGVRGLRKWRKGEREGCLCGGFCYYYIYTFIGVMINEYNPAFFFFPSVCMYVCMNGWMDGWMNYLVGTLGFGN